MSRIYRLKCELYFFSASRAGRCPLPTFSAARSGLGISLSILFLFCFVVLHYVYECMQIKMVGLDSSVGIATCYRLDGPGIESWWWWGGGRDFPHPSRPALGPIQPPIQWVPGLFPGVKRPERGLLQGGLCADKDVRNAPQAVLSRAHTLLTQCRLGPLKQFSCNKHNTQLKSDEIGRQNESRHFSVQGVANNVDCGVQDAFLNILCISTVELGYNVMKGTEYIVSL